ncbi:MAG: hypothetical protein WA863_06375 [Methyloceanibacter sp.]
MPTMSMSAFGGKADIPESPMSANDPKRTSKFGLDFCELLCLASHINVAFAYKLSGDGLDAYDAATIATKRWIEEKS